jgi:hypothetical protein
MNHKLKKPLNNPEVTDTQGVLFTFFISGLIGGIYSSCLMAVGPFGPDVTTVVNNQVVWTEDETLRWLGSGRDRFEQGGFQIMGTFVSVAIGVLAGLAVGILYRLTAKLETNEVFSDVAFAEVGDDGEEYVSPAAGNYNESAAYRSRVV